MPTGTKIFRIIICVLLSLCILSAAFFFFAVYYFDQIVIQQEDYKIVVAGIPVTRENEDDILGDGTVFMTLIIALLSLRMLKSKQIYHLLSQRLTSVFV